jgi:hypothetical protein
MNHLTLLCQILSAYKQASVADPVLFHPPDPGCFYPGSGIRCFFTPRIRDPVPGWSNGRIRIRDKTSRIRNTETDIQFNLCLPLIFLQGRSPHHWTSVAWPGLIHPTWTALDDLALRV